MRWVLAPPSLFFRCDSHATYWQNFALRTSLHYQNTYDACGMYRYATGTPASCQNCNDQNCVGCVLGSICFACSYSEGKFLSGSSCLDTSNLDCPAPHTGKYYSSSGCHGCGHYCVNCAGSNCNLGTVTGAQVFVSSGSSGGVLCDLNTHTIEYPTNPTIPVCNACSVANCVGCLVENSNTKCIECKPGNIYLPEHGDCFSPCGIDQYEYIDAVSLGCASCATGCKKCLDDKFCLECDTANNYFLVDNECQLCQTAGNNNFIDQFADPATCVSYCDSDCMACPSGSPPTCIACDKSTGYYLEGNRCHHCAVGKGWFISSSGNACLPCSKNCIECSDATSCNKCDPDALVKQYLSTKGCIENCDTKNGMFISPSGNECGDCEVNCKECSDQFTCTKCDEVNGFYLSAGDCLKCDIQNGKFIEKGVTPQTCRDCLSGCKECSDSQACSVCQPNHIKSSDSKFCSLCDPVGNFVDKKANPVVCRPCLEGCQTCQDSASCSACKVTKFLDSAATPPVCRDCQAPCLTCKETKENCLSCRPNFKYFLDQEFSKGMCLNEPQYDKATSSGIVCHSTCKTCKGPTQSDCRGCYQGKCVTILGVCEPCPGTVPFVVHPDPIIQNATFTWLVKQMEQSNQTRYKLKFSEDEILINPKFDLYDLKNHIKVSKNHSFRRKLQLIFNSG